MSIYFEGAGYTNIINQRNTGTYTFTLDRDYQAKMLFVGNGGGGCSSQKDSQWHYSGGGSGACFEGVVRLPADTYTVTIGELGYGNNRDNVHYHSSSVVSTDSYITNSAGVELIRVGAGGNGYTSVGGVSGDAGVLTMGTLDVIETKKARNGNTHNGKTAATNFSLSAYDSTASGYGAGTGAERGEGNVYGIAGILTINIKEDSKALKITDIYYNKNQESKAKKIILGFKGEKLYYSTITNNMIFNQSSTGTYTFTVPATTKYKMTFVGNGGAGGSAQTYAAWYQSCGGSGAAFEGIVKLKKGVTYTATIGTLGYGYNINSSQNYTGGADSTDSFLKDSNGNELIRVGCGVRGQTAKTGASGGTLTLGTLDIVETIIAKNGNQGHLDDPNNWSSTNAYALSAYDNTKTGYGAGTGSWYGGGNVYGVAGILKIVLV